MTTVLIEFDGVLHECEPAQVPDPARTLTRRFDPVPHGPPIATGRALVERLRAEGHAVAVFSDRASWMDGLRGIQRWLKANGFPPRLPIRSEPLIFDVLISSRVVAAAADADAMISEVDRKLKEGANDVGQPEPASE